MTDWRTPRPGHFLRWKEVVWTIKVNVNGFLHLEDCDTGETRRLRLADYQAGCFEGTVEMLEHPAMGLPDDRRALAEVSFAALPESMRTQVLRMRRYVEAYEDPEEFYRIHLPSLPPELRKAPSRMSAAKVTPFLGLVASTFTAGERVKVARDAPAGEVPPGFTTFAKWVRMWNRYRDWTLMAPRYDRRGSDERTIITGPLKRIVDRAIREVWLTRARNTKLAVCDSVEHRIGTYNTGHPDAPIAVSRRQLYRYIDETTNRHDTVKAREGSVRAGKLFDPVHQGPQARYVMETVEVDHTQAKMEVTDDDTGKSLGRPWITAALDRRSRMVVGLHIHFEGSTLNAVMQCLKNVVMPKTFTTKLVPDLDYTYACCGIPSKFFFDRGRDFDNEHVHGVGLGLDVRMMYAPGAHPEYKGGIERFMGTMHGQVAYPVKGAMRRIKDRRDEEPGAPRSSATMAFSDFCARVWHWVTMVYAKVFHKGLQDVPLDVWNESFLLRPPRPPLSKATMERLLMRTVRCEPTRQGVRHNGLLWNGEVVKRIRSHPGYRKGDGILVRIDDSDLGVAYATDPVTGRFELLEPVLRRYMSGTTMHQHEMTVRRLAKKEKGTHSELSLLQAKKRHIDEARETHLSESTTSKVRARLARDMNIGGAAPAGDGLGSLDPRSPTMAEAAVDVSPAIAPVGREVEPEPEPHLTPKRRSGPARRVV